MKLRKIADAGGHMVWQAEWSDDANQDFLGIIQWTNQRFGSQQAEIYADALAAAVDALADDPRQLGVRRIEVDGREFFRFHVAHHGRKGRHFMVFRVRDEPERILEIVRILHDSMDLVRHL
ncbi:MAG: type II toxin-antitoxin system RelE/ParE family toxin [Pseudoxanthomonas sp.]